MTRHDYYDDPGAPAPNSLVPAASAVVLDDQGRVLLHRRRDNDRWALPGGRMELGENLAGCALREIKEETGIDAEVIGIVGVYSDPKHVFAYEDGEVRQEFSICFLANALSTVTSVSDESLEVSFFDPEAITGLSIVDSIRRRINDYLSGDMPAIR